MPAVNMYMKGDLQKYKDQLKKNMELLPEYQNLLYVFIENLAITVI